SSVVWIDETEVPYLIPLIYVWNPRTGQLEKQLRERVEHTKLGYPPLKGEEICQERILLLPIHPSLQDRPYEILQSAVIFGVRIYPTRPLLRLLRGLAHVRDHPF